jgi:hypothetical protein
MLDSGREVIEHQLPGLQGIIEPLQSPVDVG